MKRTEKKNLILLLLCILLLLLCSCGKAEEISAKPEIKEEPEIITDRYEALPRLENTEINGRYAFYEGTEKLENDLICIGNRPYVYADLSREIGNLMWPLFEDETGVYMSLADFVNFNNLCAEFVPEDESVHYYFLEEYPWTEDAEEFRKAADGNPDTKAAYIRLEDIVADFGISGRFTDFNLMRTRALSDYLSSYSRAFYIAWIPVYVNPGEGIRNNIAADFNFYNADFVFTLDYMQMRGGKLGLHGLTHQHSNFVSADGIEFGGIAGRGREDLIAVFDEAAECCRSLGYDYYFFEFPHYDATPFEKGVAEEYFDMLFEYYMSKKEGVIERHELGDHTCLWVPTPADYVYSEYDRDGIISRLEYSRKHGQILSLFFHPSMDIERFACMTDGNRRSFAYYEPSGILKGLVDYLGGQGYIFDEVK